MQREPATPLQLVEAALHVVCHGPYSSALQVDRLKRPFDGPLCHNGVMQLAEVVLRTAAREVFASLRPQDLARISQALEAARESWPPRYEALDGGTQRRVAG